jgi:hypothetical protein
MNSILTVLENLDFIGALWVFVLLFMIHELEEWNITKFEHRNFIGVPPGTTAKSDRVWIAFISLVGCLWCAAATLPGDPTIAAFVLLPALVLALSNALQHIFWTFYFKQYAPGVVSAALLLVPSICCLVAWAVLQGYAPIWYVVVWAVPAVLGLAQTVRAGNRITPLVHFVHNTGIWVSQKVGL